MLAQEEARLFTHSFVGTEHILLGLIHEGDGLAEKALESLGISLQAVREEVDMTIGPAGVSTDGSLPFTPRTKKVFELSLREALALGHNYIGTEHLPLGLGREREGVAAVILEHLGADLATVRERVVSMLVGVGQERELSPPRSGVVRPEHPVRVLMGGDRHLLSEGLSFRVVGVLCFDVGVRVLWRISGIPKAIAEVLQNPVVVSPSLQGATSASISYVSLEDDVETLYVADGSAIEPQTDGEWAGSSFFQHQMPDDVRELRVGWQGEVVVIEVPPER